MTGAKHRLPRKTALLAVSTLAALSVAEAGLRIFFPLRSPTSEHFVWSPGLERTSAPRPAIVPGVEGPSRFLVNRHGIRGEPFAPEQGYRILAIGGSTTECLALDTGEAWPALLQEHLNRERAGERVWVGNVGRSGQTTASHVLETRYLLDQYPRIDAVLVLPGINDLTFDLAHGGRHEFRYAELMQRTFMEYPDQAQTEPVLKRLELYRRARALRQRFANAAHNEVDESFSIYETWREHRRSAGSIRDELPDLSEALEAYGRRIGEIIDLARDRDVDAIFATQPVMWHAQLTPDQREFLWMGGVGDFQRVPGMDYYSVEALERAMELYNERLMSVCADRDALCVDLAARLPRDTTVFYDDCHFNENGCEQVAGLLAVALEPRVP